MRTAVFRSIWLLFLLLLAACANSRLTSGWYEAIDSHIAIQHVVIFAILKDDSSEQFVEDEITHRLMPSRQAVAAHTLGPRSDSGPSAFHALLEHAGFDATVITRIVSIDPGVPYYPPQTYFESGNLPFSHYYRSFWDFYPFAQATVHAPGHTIGDRRYVIETILYRLPEGNPVRSAVTETVNPDSMLVMVDAAVDVINKQLQNAKTINTQ
ncbi:MAG TPA: hypothetical protein VFW00_05335 [Rhodocyclaceae bacterium]|nr:hypothetical protein [Rhodocyclaceae bacterium]